MVLKKMIFFIGVTLILACTAQKNNLELPASISGIYPHLAYYNNEGECQGSGTHEKVERREVEHYVPQGYDTQ